MINSKLEIMKNIVSILTLSLLLFSCSNNGIEKPVIEPLTFLQKYAGTVWVPNGDETEFYIRFINDLNQPLETWDYRTDCYYYELETLNFGDGSPLPHEITANSGDLLEISYYSYWDGNVYHEVEKYTFMITGNSLKIESKFYEDGALQNSYEPIFFHKSNVNVDSLPICHE